MTGPTTLVQALARRARTFGLALILLAFAAPSWVQAQGDLAVSDVTPGMTGFLTTETDTGIERFSVTVIGLQAADASRAPRVLIRVSNELTAATGGVAAGMSGSPVHLTVDGEARLLGAVAAGFPDSDHQLALVTPVAAMRAQGSHAGVTVGASAAGAPLLLAGVDQRAAWHLNLAQDGGTTAATSLQTAGGAGAVQDRPVAAGQTVGVALAYGDITVAAVGTVTAVDGDTAWLLGHPFIGGGVSDLALLPAEVLTVVPRSSLPFKLANVGRTPVGRVTFDGDAGLTARLDSQPNTLPVTVNVRAAGRTERFEVQVARGTELTAELVATLTQRAVDLTRNDVGRGHAQIDWTFEFAAEPPLTLSDRRVDSRDIARSVAVASGGPVAVLERNPFQDPQLTGLTVDVEVGDDAERTELVQAALETPSVTPGGTAVAFVRLQPYRNEPVIESVVVPIPDDVPPGPLTLTFRGASVNDPNAPDGISSPLDPLEQPTSERPAILSWAELIGALQARPTANEMVVEVDLEDGRRRVARLPQDAVVLGLKRLTVNVNDDSDDAGNEAGEEDGP
jgi:hypothetical protein